MKKLMIVAAAAVMTAGVSAAGLCSVETSDCQAYDVTIKLKTITPKTLKCKGGNSCKSVSQECVSYYKNGTRNLKGIIWNCLSECNLQNANFVLWRTDKGFKNAIAMNGDYFGLTEDGKSYKAMSYTDVNAEAWRYEKKANKVSMVWELAGAEEAWWDKNNKSWATDIADKEGNSATLSVYDLWFAGLGSFDLKKGIIKNVSGGVAGSVTGDPTIKVCDYEYAGLVDLCYDFEAICDDLQASSGSERLAAYGTWKMKYSKKIAGGTNSIASYIPAFAK